MSDILDLEAALTARDTALARMEKAHSAWISAARVVAKRIAKRTGEVTADDVRAVLYPRLKPAHYNAWGAVFRHSDFEFTGQFKRSAVPKGKGNMQRVWRLA